MQVVNGYQCKDCTDIDYAKKHIDPAHPKDGPYGVDKAVNDPNNTRPGDPPKPIVGPSATPSVVFGGALKGASTTPTAANQQQAPYTPGSQVNIAA